MSFSSSSRAQTHQPLVYSIPGSPISEISCSPIVIDYRKKRIRQGIFDTMHFFVKWAP